jgi:hypothetical protein
MLDSLFAIFLKERVYLKNVSPKTKVWYETAWKAFKASQGGDTVRRRLGSVKPHCKPSSCTCASVASSPSRATPTSRQLTRSANGSMTRATFRKGFGSRR